jgi:copper(I)-binding protein
MAGLVRALLLSLFGIACAAGSAAAGPLTVTDAWIRATPPGAATAAAYLTITNTGAADRLLGAATPAARGAELHTHVEEGGLHRMVHLTDGIELPAGEALRLAPGGLHVMLVDLATPLTPGKTVMLSLRFAAAGELAIEVPVVDGRASPTATHSGR